MSNESAKAFIERMKADKEFANKIAAIKDPKERIRQIKAEGFDFSIEELKSGERGLKEVLMHMEWW